MKYAALTVRLIIVWFFIFSYAEVKASHMMGSDVSYICISPGKYKIIAKVYRDCRGIPLNSPDIKVFSPNCGSSVAITYTRTAINDLSPVCKGDPGPCNPENSPSGEGIEEHVFEGIVDFNSSPFDVFKKNNCCKVYFSVEQCCRNGAITTINQGNLYTEAMLDLCNIKSSCNTSPQLSIPPVAYICCNMPFTFNNGAKEIIDGDSLHYSLANPLNAHGSNESYQGSFTPTIPMTPCCLPPGVIDCRPIPNAKPPRGLYFDENTGDIIFTPCKCDEVGVIVIQIDEYRKDSATGKYVLIGVTRRDMQLVVQKCADNNPPQVPTKNRWDVCEGNKICFTIKSTDTRTVNATRDDTTYMNWNYGIPGATFRIIDPTAREKQAEFCWQTKIGDARDYAYQFTVIVEDDNCNPKPARMNKGFLVSVRAKAQATRKYEILECGKLRFTAFPKDTVNYKGNYNYEWVIRDSTNSGLIYKKSFSKKDSFVFKRGGKYIITHTINNLPINCPTTYTDTVIMPPVLDVELAFGRDTFVCAGDSLKLKPIIANGIPKFNFHWESPLGNFKAKDTMPYFAIKPTANTSIYLKLTDKNKCVDMDTIKIHYQPLPVVNIGPDKRICTYQSITLDAQNADTLRYYWQPDGDSTRTKTINVAGTYIAKVIDHLGCNSSDTMKLFVNDTVVAIAKPDRAICILETLKVTAKRRPLGYTRQMTWTDLNTGIQMASDSAFSVKITQQADRKYDLHLRVTQSGVTCEDRDTLKLKVNALPTFKFAGIPPRCFTDGPINLCLNQVAIAMPDNKPVKYHQHKKPSWITDSCIYDYPKYITNDKVPNTGLRDSICFDYRDGNGCYNEECKLIRLNPNPDVEVKDGIFCQKAGMIELDKLIVKPFNKVGGVQSWRCIGVPDNSGVDPDVVIIPFGTSPQIVYMMDPGLEGENQKTGDYFLEYCFKNPSTSCQRCDTTRVTVVRLPEIQFDPIPAQCINYPLLALDSFVVEKNSGKRFPSGTWQCVEYGSSRDMSNNLVNKAINNSVKSQKYFDPKTIPTGGQYMLKFTDVASGCPVTDSTLVNVNGLPQITLTNPDTVCSSSAAFQLKSNYLPSDANGNWSGTFVNNGYFDPTKSPKANQYEGKYTLQYAYTNPLTKCSDTAREDILIQSQPEVSIVTTKPLQLCENDVYNVEATKNFASGTVWTGNGDGNIVSRNALKTEYKRGTQDTTDGTIQLTITTAKEGVCPQASDNIPLIFEPIPQFILPVHFEACEIAVIDFTSFVNKPYNSPNLRYSWDFGNGQSTSFGTDGNPIGIKYDTANRNGYNVRLTVHNQWGATQAESCSSTTDSNAYVRVWPTPVVSFNSDPEFFTTVAFPKFKFFDKTKAAFGPLRYYWNFGSPDPNDTTNESSQMNPIHSYPADTMVYYVFHRAEYVYNYLGQELTCFDTMTQARKIGPDVTVFVPTAFSPEGTGPRTNNVFGAVVNGEKSFHMEVFNRWGELLWKSDDKHLTWDGKFKGVNCQQDVYAWVVKVTSYDDKEYQYEGTVTLIR